MEEKFPRIELNFGNNDLRYFEISSETLITVTLHVSETETQDVTQLSTIQALDPQFVAFGLTDVNVIDENGDQVVDLSGNDVIVQKPALFFKREGTGVVKIVYFDSVTGNNLIDEVEFVVYDSFFRTNYLRYLFPTFDAEKLKENPKLLIIMNVLMEFFDILYAYRKDIEVHLDPLEVKSKYLNKLGQNLGFERLDFESEDTDMEESSDRVYRELLLNIIDLLRIRGTPLSYELFFAALGYDITLTEFWYDNEGNLIEVDPEEEDDSTFFRFDTNGVALDDPQVARPDPRKDLSLDSPVTQSNKSNFVRADISVKSGLDGTVSDPSTFTTNQKRLIRRYLAYLRPKHLQYLTETLSISVGDAEILYALDDPISILELLAPAATLSDILPDFSTMSDSVIIGDVFVAGDEEVKFPFRWNIGLKWNVDFQWSANRFLVDSISVTPQ